MKNKIIILVLILLVASLAAWFFYQNREIKKPVVNNKLKVVTTLFPLYDMAKNISGDKAEVSQLLPPGVEAHSFEPKPSDIVKINEADVFIYTGKFMEPWVSDILQGLSNPKLIVVDASAGTKMVPGVFHDEDEPAGSLDPHIWLDFDNARIMASNIAASLAEADLEDKASYEQGYAVYKNRLSALDESYQAVLSNCSNKKIVYGGHYAFGYLAKRYGLQYIAAQGVSPDAEPTALDLASLVEQIKKDNIGYVFYEELASPKIAETIAGETKAKLLMLNAAHNLPKDQADAGLSFFSIMEENLNNLRLGLGCSAQ